MASYKTFFRKTPRKRVQQYLNKRFSNFPTDFDWTKTQRVFIEELDAVISELPIRQRDAMIAEIDRIAELTDWAGRQAITEICRATAIEIEACESDYDRALFLLIEHPEVFQRAAMEAGFRRRSGGKHWTSFVLNGDCEASNLNKPEIRDTFINTILRIIETHKERRFESDWYEAVRDDPSGVHRTYQATIYVEQPREGELLFGDDGIELMPIQRVGEIGICYDPSDGILEICAPGRKKQHEEFAEAFISQFIGEKVTAVATPTREIDFARLRQERNFTTEEADRIERYEVSELVLSGASGRKATFEQRNPDETVYAFLTNEFGDRSPLRSFAWHLIGATIRIVRSPADGKGRKRTIVIDLKSPNRTNIRNRTEEDREFINMLFERWNLFLPDEDIDILDHEVDEIAV